MDPVGYAQNYSNNVSSSWRDLIGTPTSTSEMLAGEGQALLSVGAGALKGINTAVNNLLPGNSAPLQAEINKDPVLNYQPSSAQGQHWRDLLGAVTAPIGDAFGAAKSAIGSITSPGIANTVGDIATLAGARVGGETAATNGWRDLLNAPNAIGAREQFANYLKSAPQQARDWYEDKGMYRAPEPSQPTIAPAVQSAPVKAQYKPPITVAPENLVRLSDTVAPSGGAWDPYQVWQNRVKVQHAGDINRRFEGGEYDATAPAGAPVPGWRDVHADMLEQLGSRGLGTVQGDRLADLQTGTRALSNRNVPQVTHSIDDGFHRVESENGFTTAQEQNGNLQVTDTQTNVEGQGKGEGTARQQKLIDYAHNNDLNYVSDNRVSLEAAGVYQKLAKKGYNVVKNPNFIMDGQDMVSTNGRPIFQVPKQGQSASGSAIRQAPRALAPPRSDLTTADIDSWFTGK